MHIRVLWVLCFDVSTVLRCGHTGLVKRGVWWRLKEGWRMCWWLDCVKMWWQLLSINATHVHTCLVHEEQHSLTTMCCVGLCLVFWKKQEEASWVKRKKHNSLNTSVFITVHSKSSVSFGNCLVWFDRKPLNMNNLVNHKDGKREREEGKSDDDWCVCERKEWCWHLSSFYVSLCHQFFMHMNGMWHGDNEWWEWECDWVLCGL